jgi:hypothetical protein
VIRDQRHMQGSREHRTVSDVHAFWKRHVDAEGVVNPATGLRVPGELVADERTVQAYISDSRWVAACPECRGGIACWPKNTHGCCLDCGHVYTVEFPQRHDEACAELLARPHASTRNWRPDLGEDLQDLKVENIARALPLAARA